MDTPNRDDEPGPPKDIGPCQSCSWDGWQSDCETCGTEAQKIWARQPSKKVA